MPTLDETDPALIAQLITLFDNYGAAGVRFTVDQMILQMYPQAERPQISYEVNQALVQAEAQEEPRPKSLERELAETLNRHSAENQSNTPDFLLATYLMRCLQAASGLINRRSAWWGLPTDFTTLVEKPWQKGDVPDADDSTHTV